MSFHLVVLGLALMLLGFLASHFGPPIEQMLKEDKQGQRIAECKAKGGRILYGECTPIIKLGN